MSDDPTSGSGTSGLDAETLPADIERGDWTSVTYGSADATPRKKMVRAAILAGGAALAAAGPVIALGAMIPR